jgi:hypothetical protein
MVLYLVKHEANLPLPYIFTYLFYLVTYLLTYLLTTRRSGFRTKAPVVH